MPRILYIQYNQITHTMHRSYSNTNNKTKNAGVESKVGGSFYRGKGKGKTREA